MHVFTLYAITVQQDTEATKLILYAFYKLNKQELAAPRWFTVFSSGNLRDLSQIALPRRGHSRDIFCPLASRQLSGEQTMQSA